MTFHLGTHHRLLRASQPAQHTTSNPPPLMDVFNSDADFDSYWEDEARNPNRNRIRIGRQYQASVPPLLKAGESDGRKLEELETLSWQPRNELTDQQLDQYLTLAKAVTLFARAINNSNNATTTTTTPNNTNSANNSVTNCEAAVNSNNTNSNATVTNNNTNNNSESDNHSTNSNTNSDNQREDPDQKSPTSTDKSNENGDATQPVERTQCGVKQLSEFVIAHHPTLPCEDCKLPKTIPNSGSENCDHECAPKTVIPWTCIETELFVSALEVCGKNFSAIKKDYLPWKSVQSIIEHYYLGIGRHPQSNNSGRLTPKCQSSDNLANIHKLSSAAGMAAKLSNEGMPELSASLSPPPSSHILPNSVHSPVNGSNVGIKPVPNDVCVGVRSDEEEPMEEAVPTEVEIKPLKAKPIHSINPTDLVGNVSNKGSLKFYMDGQLVLKLNAKQETVNRKCSWVESQDTPKVPIHRPVRKGNKRLILEKGDHPGGNHLDEKSNEGDGDDGSGGESTDDDDSLASCESSALAGSPMTVTPRKARVKVENNCYVPLPSPLASPLPSPGTPQAPGVTFNRTTTVKQERSSPSIKREPLCSPTRLLQSTASRLHEQDGKRKVKNSVWPPFEKKRQSPLATDIGRWCPDGGQPNNGHGQQYSPNIERMGVVQQPPAAHAASRIGFVGGNQKGAINHNHQNLLQERLLATELLSLAPVDLTRKSSPSASTFSPSNDTKSPSTVSSPSTSTCSSGWDPDQKCIKISAGSPPSPPKLFSPLNYSQSTNAISPQSKSGKDVKAIEMCQKGRQSERRRRERLQQHLQTMEKLQQQQQQQDPLSSSQQSQLGWLQNRLVSYFPIYEQYYRYYCRYGLPMESGKESPTTVNDVSQTHDDLDNKGEEKSTVSEPVFDQDEDGKGMLYQLLNKDKTD